MSTHRISSMTDSPIYFEIEGLEEVQRDLESLGEDLGGQAAYDMMSDVGDHIAQWMREFAPVGKTHNLQNSIFSTTLSNEDGAVCFVGPNAQVAPYAYIQNYGGNIYPGALGYLLFEGSLGWRRIVSVRKDGKPGRPDHVYIPAHPYIEPAFTEHQEEIMEILRTHIAAAISENCGSL